MGFNSGFKGLTCKFNPTADHEGPEGSRGAVQFPYLEICWMRKWGKTKEKGGSWYEARSCFMARDV